MPDLLTVIERQAMACLSRRDYTTAELFQRLSQKSFNPTDIQTVLSTLTQKGWLNDQRFLENYIQSQQRRGIGPLRIRSALIQKGMSEEIIEPALNITDNHWLEILMAAWKKRFKGKMPQDAKSKAQQIRFLSQRGFTSMQVASLFRLEQESMTPYEP